MNGQQAVNIVKSEINRRGYNPFILIFMDCNMPILDGYEATMQIRQFLDEEC
jgi:CheY-like chemotaxis protein